MPEGEAAVRKEISRVIATEHDTAQRTLMEYYWSGKRARTEQEERLKAYIVLAGTRKIGSYRRGDTDCFGDLLVKPRSDSATWFHIYSDECREYRSRCITYLADRPSLEISFQLYNNYKRNMDTLRSWSAFFEVPKLRYYDLEASDSSSSEVIPFVARKIPHCRFYDTDTSDSSSVEEYAPFDPVLDRFLYANFGIRLVPDEDRRR
jgi:hypothetical protein